MFRSIAALILLVLAVTVTWVVVHPVALPEPRTLRVQEDEWHLPDRSKIDSAALAATIEQDKLWGSAAVVPGAPPVPVEEKPLTAPNWRIVGVVSAGADSYAMLSVDGQPIQEVKAGEKLPGDIKIVNMTADRVCILLNGKKRVLKTYKE
jgi:hypothetical protein